MFSGPYSELYENVILGESVSHLPEYSTKWYLEIFSKSQRFSWRQEKHPLLKFF